MSIITSKVHQKLVCHLLLPIEIPVLETDDAVTELQPKRSFNNLKLKTSDAHLYATEKNVFFSIWDYKYYPGLLLKKMILISHMHY